MARPFFFTEKKNSNLNKKMLKLTIIDIKAGKIKFKKLTQFEFVLKENS